MTITGAVRPAVAVAVLAGAGCLRRARRGDAGWPRRRRPTARPAGRLRRRAGAPGGPDRRLRHAGAERRPAAARERLRRRPGDRRGAGARRSTRASPGPTCRCAQIGRDARAGPRRPRARGRRRPRPTDLGMPPLADVPSTRFTLVTAEAPHVREVYAPHRDGGHARQRAHRRAGGGPRASCATCSTSSPAVGSERRRPAPRVLRRPRRWPPSSARGSASGGRRLRASVPEPVPWPGPALPGEPIGRSPTSRCVTATGDEAHGGARRRPADGERAHPVASPRRRPLVGGLPAAAAGRDRLRGPRD